MLIMVDIKRECKIAYSELRFKYSKLDNVMNANKFKLGRDFLTELDIGTRSHFFIW